MRLLAIDTALEACSVAVARDGAPPVVISEVIGKGHAERLMPMIEEAMTSAGLGFAGLDRIAVTIGPGSFTGVRVGIAAARGIGLVNHTRLVGIGTLAVHAEEARSLAGSVPVLTVLDARRGELYGQAFSETGAELGPPELATARDFAARIMPGMVLAGSGADLVAAELRSPRPVIHRRSAPDVTALLRLAKLAPASDIPPRPIYLRPPDAKPQSAARIARR